jgi:histidine ammonia-lyase
MTDLVLDGRWLHIDRVVEFGEGAGQVSLSPALHQVIAQSRAIVDAHADSNEPIYGLTTALGSKVTTALDPANDGQRERDVVTGRMVGVGEPYSPSVARSAMLIRLHGVSRGAAGVSPGVVDVLEKMINAGLVVCAPRMGTIGASDFAPGASLAGALIGLGSVWLNGERTDAADAFARCGIEPATLASKDALGVINSSAFSLAHAAHVAVALRETLGASLLAAVANADAFGVNPRVYGPDVQTLKPLPHTVEVATLTSRLLEGSWVFESVTSPQQAISFRALVPQFASVVGALERFIAAVEREINGIGDNPVVVFDSRSMSSTSHFHTIDLALHGDALSLSLYHWADSCAQRVQRTINHRNADLPLLLAHGGAAATGMNPLQKTVGDVRGRIRHLASPASLDALVVSDQVEDLASQLPLVVDAIAQQSELLKWLVLIESLVALQCHALRGAHLQSRASVALSSLFADIEVPLGDDVPLGPTLERMAKKQAALAALAAQEIATGWPASPLIGHSSP